MVNTTTCCARALPLPRENHPKSVNGYVFLRFIIFVLTVPVHSSSTIPSVRTRSGGIEQRGDNRAQL